MNFWQQWLVQTNFDLVSNSSSIEACRQMCSDVGFFWRLPGRKLVLRKTWVGIYPTQKPLKGQTFLFSGCLIKISVSVMSKRVQLQVIKMKLKKSGIFFPEQINWNLVTQEQLWTNSLWSTICVCKMEINWLLKKFMIRTVWGIKNFL